MSAILSRPFVLMGAPYGGTSYFGNGSAAAPSISFASDPDTGFYRAGTDEIGVALGGSRQFSFGSGGYLYGANVGSYLLMPSTGAISLVASGTNQNITLTPSGTGNVVVERSGLIVSTIVQNTSLADGGARLTLIRSTTASPRQWSIGVGEVSTDALSVVDNTASVIRMHIPASGNLLLGTTTDSSNGRLQFATHSTPAGGIGFGTSASEVIYRSAANTLTTESNFFVNADIRAAGPNSIYWAGRAQLRSPADGIIQLANSANTDFSRLQFGGTTGGFPALRRTGAQLDVVNGDATAYAVINAFSFVAQNAAPTVGAGTIAYGGTTATSATAGAQTLPANPAGFIIVNVAGTVAKIPYYNN